MLWVDGCILAAANIGGHQDTALPQKQTAKLDSQSPVFVGLSYRVRPIAAPQRLAKGEQAHRDISSGSSAVLAPACQPCFGVLRLENEVGGTVAIRGSQLILHFALRVQ